MATELKGRARWHPPSWLAIVVATVKRFYADRGLEAAAALTYTSLLSLVPLLALMFAVLKGLGAQHRLEPILLAKLSLDPEVTARLLEWIDHTNVGTIGALGAVFLIVTVISVLGSIESMFNMVWRVRHGRTWWRKVTDYVSVVVLIPFLLLFAVGITSALREQAILRALLSVEVVHGVVLFLLGLAPIAMNVVALGMLYAVMPNRRPHAKSILIAALIAGFGWQTVQDAYVSLQFGVARASAIYGALAQLPVTLVWIYVSWAVVLAGAQLAAVIEFGPEPNDERTRDVSRWAVALHVLVRAAEHFRTGRGPVRLGEVARDLEVNSEVAAECVQRLCEAGAVAPTGEDQESFVLAHDPASLLLAVLADLFGEAGSPEGADPRVAHLLRSLARARRDDLARTTLADLLELAPAAAEPTARSGAVVAALASTPTTRSSQSRTKAHNA
ncbi:MAG: YihY family inner membrane protein [Deltaproteobacteria bacterium]|nr:YihY family inner membrane protein [Deltaproteobacteria bacterium]